MSDVMYYDKKISWKDIAVHDDKNIKGSKEPYKFLSNFESCIIYGVYPSVENAYMADKVIPEDRKYFTTCTAVEAKKGWRNFKLLDKTAAEWDKRKFEVMEGCLREKFIINQELRQKLIDTGDRYLKETNWWGDSIWGVDIEKGGENNLGKMLMKIRDVIKHTPI